jgi:hypothetical protein
VAHISKENATLTEIAFGENMRRPGCKLRVAQNGNFHLLVCDAHHFNACLSLAILIGGPLGEQRTCVARRAESIDYGAAPVKFVS